VTDESEEQCAKHDEHKISTLHGITIDESEEQCAKHDEPRISTLHGITIVGSDDSENAFDSIRIKREVDSNEIDERDLHL
jgi:hypothetical protein